MKQQQEQWSSKLGFILATAGSAIGLGAIWKFPYMVGVSGGGAFFFIFIIFTLFIGLPIFLAEFIIGRGSHKINISAITFFYNSMNLPIIAIFIMCICVFLVV